jgi:micrococcal nuclease
MRSLSYWRRHWIKFLVFVGFMLLITAAESGWLGGVSEDMQQNQPGLYSIDHFIDGDTIAVNMNGSVETVRMIGVDTPETHKPNTPVQCYGPQAADFTKNLIGKNSVRLQADPLDTNRDRYGRLLRYVYLPDGRLVEKELISNGYGFAYTLFPFQKKDDFVADMQTAQTAKKGLWAACQVHQESDGAYQTNPASS